jgi:hypothetical protein
MASRLLQRGLTAGGAASSLTVCSWMGEQGTSRATSKIASRLSMEQSLLFKKGTIMRPNHKVFSSSAKEAVPSSSLKEAISSSPKEAVPIAPKQSSKSFVEWYEGHLQYAPVGTKMVTGGILWGIGDAVAQLIPQLAFEENDADKKKTSSLSALTYDLPRTGRAVFFGFALHAPTSHVHFNFLEWMTVRAGVTGLGIPVFKAVMEQVRIFKAIPYTFRTMFGCSRLTHYPLVFYVYYSLSIGVGFRIPCTMVLWVPCKA